MGAIATIIGFIGTAWGVAKDILTAFGVLKPAAKSEDVSRKLGQQETQSASQQREIQDVTASVEAQNAERTAVVSDPGRLRDGTGPGARPYRPGPD